MKNVVRLGSVALLLALAACSSSTDDGGAPGTGTNPTGKTDEQFKTDVVNGMHASILGDIETLAKAAADLQAAAPTPTGRGWDRTQDAAAIAQMKDAWVRARDAYEHIEGAIAPIFPQIDAAIDERYDGFLEELGAAGDPNLFDDQGVTGMHAVERILWSDAIPEVVVKTEKTMPGYAEAKIPSTEAEAQAFKTKLAAKLVADCENLKAQWQPAKIDIESAYDGLIGLMNEQFEKVSNASAGLEESRYSQATMRDVRSNLEGTRKIYAVFSPWIASKPQGTEQDKKVTDAFERLKALYGAYPGDAIPTPPASWSAENPSETDRQTPFGKLYSGVEKEADVKDGSSAVGAMSASGQLLGFKAFVQE